MKHPLRKGVAVLVATSVLAVALYLGTGLARPLDPIPRFGQAYTSLVIANVTVIDAGTGTALAGRSVQIVGDRITAILPSRPKTLPARTVVIDGSGRFLIPGLWDAHVHTLQLSDRLHFPLLRAHGITTIRNMGDGCSWRADYDCIADSRQWQSPTLAPHILTTASYHIEALKHPADAAPLVARLKARGDGMIKVQLEAEADPALFRALVIAAQRAAMPVAGHLPPQVNLTDPVYAALASIEHDTALTRSCTSAVRCDQRLGLLAQRGTTYTPTHVASSGEDVRLSIHRMSDDHLLPYVSAPISTLWRLYRWLHASGIDAADRATLQKTHQSALALTMRAHRAGVPLLAGSDALDPFVLHGLSLHDELGYFVRAGLSPTAALRTATTTPARFLGRYGNTGLISPGQRADLILLIRNPLVDIAATKTIDTVISRGMIYRPTDRAEMAAFVNRQANSHAVNARAWWAMLRP